MTIFEVGWFLIRGMKGIRRYQDNETANETEKLIEVTYSALIIEKVPRDNEE